MIAEIDERRRELEQLCTRFAVRRLEVFGSASTQDSLNPESDIDFLVEFDILRVGYADHYFGLHEALQALFRRPVDLVVASAIRNPYFLQAIASTRSLLYAA